jgi:phage repressor protein C with HTH and peptisase S24 domain
MLDDSLLIICDNPAYGKETVPAARVKALEVVGRVVWPRIA